jgi:hypothetical protein
MVSEPNEVPEEITAAGAALRLVFVVLLTDKPVPLIMPYLYDRAVVSASDPLSQWCLINSEGSAVRQSVTF